jgi:Alpha-kinase family
MNSSAARTNLTSRDVVLHRSQILGVGQFRTAYAGTYVGGNRNQQEAVCKAFKAMYHELETDFYSQDFHIASKAIQFAEDWNAWCPLGKEILVTHGDVMNINGTKYLVEPLIRFFQKYTSNNGWIADGTGWQGEAMEAFSHFTYHRSGGSMIVCDLQGRYRHNQYSKSKCRFELTDPAICSRSRSYGVTDLGEKGIESFFANHVCNQFCSSDGGTRSWQRPRHATQWFESNSGTSMLNSGYTNLLKTTNRRVKFTSSLDVICDDDEDDEYEDMWG